MLNFYTWSYFDPLTYRQVRPNLTMSQVRYLRPLVVRSSSEGLSSGYVCLL